LHAVGRQRCRCGGQSKQDGYEHRHGIGIGSQR
jgi:hypothetical protein